MSEIPVVSSRKKFYRTGAISRQDKTKIVNLSDPRPSNNREISNENLLNLVRGKRVIILVHGYNNTFSEVCDAYLRLTNQLKANSVPHDQVIGYIWPGGDKKLSYFAAKKRARKLAPRISDLLESLSDQVQSIDIIAHSMGCFLSLSTLKKAKGVKLNNIYLMAPAVKNFMLSDDKHFSSAAKKSNGAFVFKSTDDMVLRFAFSAGEGQPALGYTGPMPFATVVNNCIVIDCSNQPDPIDHGAYSRRTEIYSFIRNNPGPVSSSVEVKL